MFFSYDLASQTSINILKIVQFFSALGTFVTPILLFGYLLDLKFGFKNSIVRQNILLAIGVILLITPLVSFLIEVSLAIDFPDWIKKFDRNSEALILAFLKMDNFTDLLANILVMAIIPAIGEELFFRGFIQNTLSGFFKNNHTAIAVTAILFSLIHFDLEGFIPRFFLGAILGYMFFWTKSLWVPIIAHFTNNALAIVISYPYFKSFDLVQNFNHYGESTFPEISNSAITFSVCSVCVLLYLMYSNSNQEISRN